MKWVEMGWVAMASASLTLGLIHLFAWQKHRSRYAHLVFFAVASSAAVFGVFELMMMRAQTPDEYAIAMRWGHIPLSVFVISLVAFVRLYFDAGRLWLGLATCGLRLLTVILNFSTGVNVNFQTVTALEHLTPWGGTGAAVPIGVPNPWGIVPQISNLLLVAFVVDAALTLWRRGGRDARRRAVLVGGGLAFSITVAAGMVPLILAGVVRAPTILTPAFFAIVVVMGYELSRDVVSAARLAEELRASEGNLRQSEQRMQLAAGAASLALWEWDIARDEIWMTGDGRSMFGFAPAERLDLARLLQSVHPDDRDAVRRDVGTQSDARDVDVEREFRLLLADGRTCWVSSRYGVELDTTGKPARLRGVALDVTARRQAEERMRAVVEAAPSAILLADMKGRITLANAQAESVFGYARDEFLGRLVEFLIPDRFCGRHEAHRSGYLADARARAMGVGRELFALHKDGHEVPVEVGLVPLQTSAGVFILVSIVDISERRRSERAAATQRDELAHLSRVAMLGELSGSLAHELNQPLTAILSNAQAAQRFLARNPPDLGRLGDILADIVKNDRRAGLVIQRLRALIKKEEAKFDRLDVNEVVQDSMRLVQSDLLYREVTVSTALAPDLDAVHGDRVQLQQVLLNFIVNGCDAMDDRKADRALIVETRSTAAGGIEICVTDRGKGIPSSDLERIFEPFVTTKGHGMGLGLAICRSIVDSHGGRVWATNNQVCGATLHCELPAHQG